MMRSCGGLIGCDQLPQTKLVIGGCAVQSSAPEKTPLAQGGRLSLLFTCAECLHYCHSCPFMLVCRHDNLTSTFFSVEQHAHRGTGFANSF
jgi:hypothetical protein